MAARVLAIVIVVVVVVYHVLRLMASSCSGGACDWYIPFSLLLPIIAMLLAVLTGALGAYAERARLGWSVALAVCAVLALIGPILAAIALSDNDTKVWIATGLILLVPLAVGLSAVRRPTTIKS